MPTMTRTDIHRPSADEFDPSLYTDEAGGDYGSQYERPDMRQANAAIARLEAQGYRFADHQVAGQCGHCGARLRYFALLSRVDTKELLIVGEQCLSHRFRAGMTKVDFQALRRAAELDRKAQRKLAAFRELCDAHPGLAYASYAGDIMDAYVNAARGNETPLHIKAGAGWALGTLVDIAYKARKYGEASPKQIAFVERLLREIDEKLTAYAAKQAAEAANPAPPAPAGRVEVEGTVVSVRWEASDWGSLLKGLVVTDAGWRVWTTIPQSVGSVDKGDRIAFTAKLDPKQDDPSFAFASRPTKGRMVTKAA